MKVECELIDKAFMLMKYKNPLPVQAQLLKMLDQKYLVIRTSPGSGKTFSFLIKALHSLDVTKPENQVIIISSTRELATQTYRNYLSKLSEIGINSALLISNKEKRKSKLSNEDLNAHILVGTLGKVTSFIRSRGKYLNKIRLLILDECDKLIQQNKNSCLTDLTQSLSMVNSLVLVSTTFDDSTKKFYCDIFQNSEFDYIDSATQGEEKIGKIIQGFALLPKTKSTTTYEQKLEFLSKILANVNFQQAIVFYNNKSRGEEITHELRNSGFNISYLSADLSFEKRNKIYENFKCAESHVIVTTDLLSRGIDIEIIDLIINFDLPHTEKDYCHRIGRTGRNSKNGVSILFFSKVSEYDEYKTKYDVIPMNEISDINIAIKSLQKENIQVYSDEAKTYLEKIKFSSQTSNAPSVLLSKKRREVQYQTESIVGQWVEAKCPVYSEEKLSFADPPAKLEESLALANESLPSTKKKFCIYCDLIKHIIV